VKGVLLDLGETLLYVDLKLYRRYKEEVYTILQNHGYESNHDEVFHSIDHAFANTTKDNIRTTCAFWKKVLESLEIPPTSKLIDDIERFWKKNIHQMMKFYENARTTLTYLNEKYHVALVSNCAVGMREILETLEVVQFFDCIILSYEVGVRKPEPTMYLEALRGLELNAEDCIFVSDRVSDLEGAKKVGLKTLLVRQGAFTLHNIQNPHFQSDFEITTIADITTIL
jgi:HAD superfamily hydrolase (TIGR01509 family)